MFYSSLYCFSFFPNSLPSKVFEHCKQRLGLRSNSTCRKHGASKRRCYVVVVDYVTVDTETTKGGNNNDKMEDILRFENVTTATFSSSNFLSIS